MKFHVFPWTQLARLWPNGSFIPFVYIMTSRIRNVHVTHCRPPSQHILSDQRQGVISEHWDYVKGDSP